jgi:hypothetical protein
MALEDVFPIIIGRCARILRTNCVMPRLINYDLAAELNVQGGVINVPFSNTRKATPVIPGPVPPQGNTPAPTVTPVTLDYWMNDSFNLDDRQISSLATNSDFITTEMAAAAAAVADSVNESIFAQYSQIPTAVGVAGTTPFATSLIEAQAAHRQLSVQKVPKGNRHIVLDPFAYANAIGIETLQRVDASGSNITLREAEVGRALGFDWHEDQTVPTHTLGAAGTITVAGAQAVNASTLNVTVMWCGVLRRSSRPIRR